MNSEIEKVLSSNEKIIWEGKPQAFPYLVSKFVFLFVFFILYSSVTYNPDTQNYENAGPFAIMLGIFLFIVLFIYNFLFYKKIHYAITDKRVILQKGIIGTDFESVDFDKINSIKIDIGIIDKVLGKNSGTIMLDSGRMKSTSDSNGYSTVVTDYHQLQFIDDAYNVFEKLKTVSTDVKADIKFPNALRPGNNPGYKTEIK
jgi:membrane protein YdbS with pleckstrin-like domain